MNPFTSALICSYYLRKRIRNKRRRRYHVHPVIVDRLIEGEFCTLYSKLRVHEENFFDYFRMSTRSFDELLAKLESKLKHQNMYRAPVAPVERLAVTLRYIMIGRTQWRAVVNKIRYIMTGRTYEDLYFSYRLGTATISGIVKEVCTNIWELLHEECLSIPKSQEEWLKIAAGFEQNANFPNCIGSIDGKHIRIICPDHSGSLFSNYKKYYSVVLLAMCDSDYRFTYINVGSYGTDFDSNIFKNSTLYNQLHSGEIILPQPKPLPTATEPLPYMVIGDAAFGISNKVLRPYARSNLTYKKKIFNYRLSRARRYIESTFGILSNKFRIFHRPMNTSLPNTITVVKACCVLHNYIRERDGYRVEDTLSVGGLEDLSHIVTCLTLYFSGDMVRDRFANYFISSDGSVSWQDASIF